MARAEITYHSQGEEWISVSLATPVKSPDALHDLKNRVVDMFAEAMAEAGFREPLEDVEAHTAESLTAMVGEMEFSDNEE